MLINNDVAGRAHDKAKIASTDLVKPRASGRCLSSPTSTEYRRLNASCTALSAMPKPLCQSQSGLLAAVRGGYKQQLNGGQDLLVA